LDISCVAQALPLVTVKCGYTSAVAGQLCENVTRYSSVEFVALIAYSGVEGKARVKLAAVRKRDGKIFMIDG
jgi:hypothetical protein